MSVVPSYALRPSRRAVVTAINPFYVQGTNDLGESLGQQGVFTLSPTGKVFIRAEFPVGVTLPMDSAALNLNVKNIGKIIRGSTIQCRLRKTIETANPAISTITSNNQPPIDPSAVVYFSVSSAGDIEINITPLISPERHVYTFVLDYVVESALIPASSDINLQPSIIPGINIVSGDTVSGVASLNTTSSALSALSSALRRSVASTEAYGTFSAINSEAISFMSSQSAFTAPARANYASAALSNSQADALFVTKFQGESYSPITAQGVIQPAVSSVASTVSIVSSGSSAFPFVLIGRPQGAATLSAASALYTSKVGIASFSALSSIKVDPEIFSARLSASSSLSAYMPTRHLASAALSSTSSLIATRWLLSFSSPAATSSKPYVRLLRDVRTPDEAVTGRYMAYLLFDVDNDLGNSRPIPYFELAEARRVAAALNAANYFTKRTGSAESSIRISPLANVLRQTPMADVYKSGTLNRYAGSQLTSESSLSAIGSGVTETQPRAEFEYKVTLEYIDASKTFIKAEVDTNGNINQLDAVEGIQVGDLTLYPVGSLDIPWMEVP